MLALVASTACSARTARAPSPRPASRAQPHAIFVDSLDVTTFRRGSIHAHSKRSDGDAEPEEIYGWYREHGYAFVALTDHNLRSDPDEFSHLEVPGSFVIIAGEEVSLMASGRHLYPVHLNALCHDLKVGGAHASSVGAALTWGVTHIHAAGGIAIVNHPNYKWAVSVDDLRYAVGAELIEIWSGHPQANSAGEGSRPSAEAVWEAGLKANIRLAPVAVDDVHHLHQPPPDAEEPKTASADRTTGSARDVPLDRHRKHPPVSGPGRAWIEVFSNELTRAAVCDDIGHGRLIASNGARLKRLSVRDAIFEIEPDEDEASVEYIGRSGILKTERVERGRAASYHLADHEPYVRARISTPDGRRAWTAAYRAVW